MFSFAQSMHTTEFKYVEDQFEYIVKTDSGKRIEDKNSVRILTCENLLSLKDIRLNIGKNELTHLQSLLKIIRNNLWSQNIKFSAFMKLHNEKVLIDETKIDIRSYGLIRIVLEDESKNLYWDDVSVVSNDMEILEQKINLHVKNNAKIIKNKRNTCRFLNWVSTPVIFSPRATGYLIHEIIGHTLEGDLYSYYKNQYKDLKISKKLTVCDSVDSGGFMSSINKYDDLGIRISPCTLVNDQKICNIMSIEEKESINNGILYGFARRESYKKEVMPRMRCTHILPSENLNLSQVSAKYDHAILMDKAYLGGVDVATGNYFVEGNGFSIKNGEKQNIICDLKIAGNIEKNLYTFEYVGNDFDLFGTYCMKLGHYVRVGCGGPTVSLNNVILIHANEIIWNENKKNYS